MVKPLLKPVLNFEVAIIRNLIHRGYSDREIGDLIDSKRRTENKHGIDLIRIEEIKTDDPIYKGIESATDEEVEKYLSDVSDSDPVSDITLQKLLPQKSGIDNELNIIETDIIECKELFENDSFSKYVKHIAALANRKGGYIIFGVKDGSYEIAGIEAEKFERYDQAKIVDTMTNAFGHVLQFTMKSHMINGKTIGVFYVLPFDKKPVMFIKDSGPAREGDIYYRYPGSSRRIKPSDLNAIIDERIEKHQS